MNAVTKTIAAETVHASLYAALSAAQSELKNPEKTKEADTGKYKYKYADIGDVLEAVLPVLSKHGLSLMQPTKIENNSIILVTRIAHSSGETVESEYPVCSLNGNHQAMGSAMTYARRYALTSLLGIAAVDDTDGKDAAPSGEGERVKMSAHQAKKEVNWGEIQAAIDKADSFEKLTKRAEEIEQRKGFWPDTYYHKARERVYANRLDLVNAKLAETKDIDALNDAFTLVEAALDGVVKWDEIAAIHRQHEDRILNAEPFSSPMMAG